jgi:hypothetical protein
MGYKLKGITIDGLFLIEGLWIKLNVIGYYISTVNKGVGEIESVFDFYMKKGFYPRLTYMELKG